MKYFVLLLFLLPFYGLVAQEAYADESAPEEEYHFSVIEAGTPVFLTTHNEMTTKHLKSGQTICLYLKFPIKVDGYKVIPAGTPAYCKISQSQKPGGNGRAGYIEIEPLWIQYSKDEVLPLTGNAAIRMGRDRETLSQAMFAGGMAASGLLEQAQEISDVNAMQKAERRAHFQEQLALKEQQKSFSQGAYDPSYAYHGYAPGFSEAAPAPQVFQAPVGPLQVARTITNVIPLVGLLIRGKHAVVPKGYILSAYVGNDLVVELPAY